MENGAFAPSGANAPFSIMFSMLTFLRCVKVRGNAFIWVNGLRLFEHNCAIQLVLKWFRPLIVYEQKCKQIRFCHDGITRY